MKNVKITIVLLPGLNGTEGLFQALIDQTPDQFNVLSISYPTHQKYSYQQLVVYVQSKISELESEFILVGESFSGPLALFIAQAKPKALIGVILVASFVTSPNYRFARFLPWALGFSLAKPLYALRLLLSKKQYTALIRAASRELQKVSPKVLADRVRSIFSVNAESALRDCAVPIVYFRGRKDFVVPRKNLDHIVSIRPSIKIVEFDTQHFLLQSAPAQAWVAIAEFSAELKNCKTQA